MVHLLLLLPHPSRRRVAPRALHRPAGIPRHGLVPHRRLRPRRHPLALLDHHLHLPIRQGSQVRHREAARTGCLRRPGRCWCGRRRRFACQFSQRRRRRRRCDARRGAKGTRRRWRRAR
ncbi:hypothetical protein MUK42_14667 [Musa troglodytarum]|uniref:Uncharacterized protein n=1 Tax=Musa troglodytarum TaxID=320322 RepID=A0A9E7IEM6_9LILI|nr:hypothetical protein MUK42_14667 [Musa troglodytarum]